MPPRSFAADFGHNYLSANLAGELIGIAVLQIRDVLRLQKPQPVQHLPAYVRGVIRVQERTIPVIDLAARFELPAVASAGACIVVVRVQPEPENPVDVGLIVDSIGDVISAPPATIHQQDSADSRLSLRYLIGRTSTGPRPISLLDLDETVDRELLRDFSGSAEIPVTPRLSL
jgi:purine-binding chemotaxis protein CheW